MAAHPPPVSIRPVSLAPPDAFNPSYTGARYDTLSLLDRAPASVLDVGCATGATGAVLHERYGSRVTGIEVDAGMVEVARTRLSAVHLADLNAQSLPAVVGSERYDLIHFGDVLEHLVDPWTTLAQARTLLTRHGRIIASLPNVGHWSTIANLLFLQRWPYRDRGIHDRTHLRFFTRESLNELYRTAGLSVVRERRKLRLIEHRSPVNRIARYFDFPPFRRYLTFQYMHLLASAEAPEPPNARAIAG